MNQPLARTPLYDWHVAHGGRMVEFGGWEMPVQYTSIVEEHLATRNAVGLFDISHMGRLRFDGERAGAYLNSLVTRKVDDLLPGQIRYGLLTNARGGVLDDVLVYKLRDGSGGTYHLMVVNAGNRAKVLEWLAQHPPPAGVIQTDLTTGWAMMAVQGRKALEILSPLCEAEIGALKYYTGTETRIGGAGGIISRTGYTGEDGFELIVGSPAAPRLWNELVERARSVGGLPCGLGARDTLRLESAMPLYGHELNEQTDPLCAGLEFAVDFDKADYPGRSVLQAVQQRGCEKKLIGLKLSGKRVPRERYSVLADGATVGQVTSGTFSPTLQAPIAMAYVRREHAVAGKELAVDIRGQATPAVVVKLPFYRRKRDRGTD